MLNEILCLEILQILSPMRCRYSPVYMAFSKHDSKYFYKALHLLLRKILNISLMYVTIVLNFSLTKKQWSDRQSSVNKNDLNKQEIIIICPLCIWLKQRYHGYQYSSIGTIWSFLNVHKNTQIIPYNENFNPEEWFVMSLTSVWNSLWCKLSH